MAFDRRTARPVADAPTSTGRFNLRTARPIVEEPSRPQTMPASPTSAAFDAAETFLPQGLRPLIPMRELPRIGAQAVDTALFGLIPNSLIDRLPPIESGLGKTVNLVGQGAALMEGGPFRVGQGAARLTTKAIPALTKSILGRAVVRGIEGGVAGAATDVFESPEATAGKSLAGATADIVLTPAVQRIAEGVGEGVGKLRTLFKRRPPDMERLLKLPAEEQAKLAPDLLGKVQAEQARRLRFQEGQARQQVRMDRLAEQRRLRTERARLNETFRNASDTAVMNARPSAQQYLRSTSDEYERLLTENMAQEGLTAFEVEKLRDAALERFAKTPAQYDPDSFDMTMQVIGWNPESALQPGRVPPPPTFVTPRQILQRADDLSQRVNRSPGHVRNKAEQVAENVRGFLLDQLEAQGLEVRQAKAFWAEHAPFRRTVLQKLRPYETTGDTSVGANYLRKAAIDPGTRRAVMALQDKLGTNLTDDILNAYARLHGNTEALAQLTEGVERQLTVLKQLDETARRQRWSQNVLILEQSKRRALIRKWVGLAIAGAIGARSLGGLGRFFFGD